MTQIQTDAENDLIDFLLKQSGKQQQRLNIQLKELSEIVNKTDFLILRGNKRKDQFKKWCFDFITLLKKSGVEKFTNKNIGSLYSIAVSHKRENGDLKSNEESRNDYKKIEKARNRFIKEFIKTMELLGLIYERPFKRHVVSYKLKELFSYDYGSFKTLMSKNGYKHQASFNTYDKSDKRPVKHVLKSFSFNDEINGILNECPSVPDKYIKVGSDGEEITPEINFNVIGGRSGSGCFSNNNISVIKRRVLNSTHVYVIN